MKMNNQKLTEHCPALLQCDVIEFSCYVKQKNMFIHFLFFQQFWFQLRMMENTMEKTNELLEIIGNVATGNIQICDQRAATFLEGKNVFQPTIAQILH